MTNENKIALNFYDSLLRESDVDLLTGPYWLNDTVVSFYFVYLEKVLFSNENRLLFVSPEVTQCLKLIAPSEVGVFLDPLQAQSKEFVFFALNDNDCPDTAGGSHWSLLVYSKPEKGFFHFDSLSSLNIDSACVLARHLTPYLAGPKNGECNVTKMESLSQANVYDCGIHVLCNVEMVVQYVLKNARIQNCGLLDIESVNRKRHDILNIIYELAAIHLPETT